MDVTPPGSGVFQLTPHGSAGCERLPGNRSALTRLWIDTLLSNETLRNGQQSALASDIVALMDALKIEKAIIGGFDWGARTANIMAALWPERCKAMVSVSGYLIGSQAATPPTFTERTLPFPNGDARCRLRLSRSSK